MCSSLCTGARRCAVQNRGNEHFRKKDFVKAWEYFNQAISADGSEATFFSNRCALRCGSRGPALTVQASGRGFALRVWDVARHRMGRLHCTADEDRPPGNVLQI